MPIAEACGLTRPRLEKELLDELPGFFPNLFTRSAPKGLGKTFTAKAPKNNPDAWLPAFRPPRVEPDAVGYFFGSFSSARAINR